MYYIFNKKGDCTVKMPYEPNIDDLATRQEKAIQTDVDYEIDKILLIDGQIKQKPTPEPTLEQSKTVKIANFKDLRDQEEISLLEYNKKPFDYDDKARERMRIAEKALVDNNIQSQKWTCADNTQMQLTIQDFKNINTLAATRSGELHTKYNRLKEQINQATTANQLQEINW